MNFRIIKISLKVGKIDSYFNDYYFEILNDYINIEI